MVVAPSLVTLLTSGAYGVVCPTLKATSRAKIRKVVGLVVEEERRSEYQDGQPFILQCAIPAVQCHGECNMQEYPLENQDTGR